MSNWIPCQDRQPDKEGNYLVLVHNTGPFELPGSYTIRQMRWSLTQHSKKPKPRWEEPQGCLAWRDPLLWQPLPEVTAEHLSLIVKQETP